MDTNTVAGSAPTDSQVGVNASVVLAASIGTLFEWYDFVLYGSLAPMLAKKFFAGVDPATAFIFALLTFAVGFIMRPFGALVFGRIGDMVGRKKTFAITIVVMGLSTVGVGLLPDYATLGIVAPIALVTLRSLQGLAVGGEYGGAIVYVAEHAAPGRRAYSTSWIASTGTVGLLLSFGVLLAARELTGDSFDTWGWRLPFLFSLPLLAISVWIRLSMAESPSFQKLKAEQRLSRAPVSEVFTQGVNLRRTLLSVGLCAGMTCIYYTASLYPTFFLTQMLKVDPKQVNAVVLWVTCACLPFFIIFGWATDRFGRKPMLMIAYVLGICAYFPTYHGLAHFANPALEAAQQRAPVIVEAASYDCSFMFNPVGSRKFTSSCDVARQALTASGVSYQMEMRGSGGLATIHIGSQSIPSYDATSIVTADLPAKSKSFTGALRSALGAASYPKSANLSAFNTPMVFILLLIPMVLSVMVIVPVAPMLVELFPTRIRYTAISFPYHFSAGWIGGLLPTMAFALSTLNGNIYFGLWYPLGWTLLALICCVCFLKETKDVDIND